MSKHNRNHSFGSGNKQRASRWQGIKEIWKEDKHTFYNGVLPEIAGIVGVSVGITIALMLMISLLAVAMHGNSPQTAAQVSFYFTSLSYDIFSNVLLMVVLLRYGLLCLAANGRCYQSNRTNKSNQTHTQNVKQGGATC